jgi:hypothetical protein
MPSPYTPISAYVNTHFPLSLLSEINHYYFKAPLPIMGCSMNEGNHTAVFVFNNYAESNFEFQWRLIILLITSGANLLFGNQIKCR